MDELAVRVPLAVLNRITEQVLEEVSEPIGVGWDHHVAVDSHIERRAVCLDSPPTPVGELRKRHALGLADVPALLCESERLLDDRPHPVEGVVDRVEVLGVVRPV